MTRKQRICQCCDRARAFNAAGRVAAMNLALDQARKADDQKFIDDHLEIKIDHRSK